MIQENISRILGTLPAGVKLVAVSKYRPLEELQQAYEAGQRVFAENRPLELASKAPALPGDIQWHFIGHLQTNKLRYVMPYVYMIQSIDSEHLLDAIERWCAANGRTVRVLLEMHIGQEETKQGLDEEAIHDILSRSSTWPHIIISGLMGMASHTDSEERIRADFSRIRRCFDSCRNLSNFTELSIGMSDDYEIALDYSPTMVRIGSKIFLR